MTRYTVYYSGHVQGVGFRYTCCQCAENCMVAGYVMNLEDGRVKLVADGDEAELKALLKLIAKRMGRNITSHTVDATTSNGEFGPPELSNLNIKY